MNFLSGEGGGGLLPSRLSLWPDSLSLNPSFASSIFAFHRLPQLSRSSFLSLSPLPLPPLPLSLFRRKRVFLVSFLHARSSADPSGRYHHSAQLLRDISDHFLMKYSRCTTKSSFVSQRHFSRLSFGTVSHLLSCKNAEPPTLSSGIVIFVAYFFLPVAATSLSKD